MMIHDYHENDTTGGGYDVINSTQANATASTQDDDIMSSTLLRVLFVAMYAVIFLLGVSGNALVVVIVWRNKTLQTITNIFIANLAASDVMVCLLAVPFTPISGLLTDWIFGKVLCHIVPMAMGASIYLSTLTSTAIAIDRYFAIVHPFRPRMTVNGCLLAIVGIWAASFGVTLPLAIHQDVTIEGGSRMCVEDWPQPSVRRMFTVGSLMLQYLVPCIVIIVCYWRVSVALRRRARNKKSLVGTGAKQAAADVALIPARDDTAPSNGTGPSAATSTPAAAILSRRDQLEIRRNRRTNRMLIASVAIFVCCWLPLNVINLIIEYEGVEFFGSYFLLEFFIFHVFAMSSTVYNPFLYAWMNDSFRIEFNRALPRCLLVAFGCTGGSPTGRNETGGGSRRDQPDGAKSSSTLRTGATRPDTAPRPGPGPDCASRSGVGALESIEPDEAEKLISATTNDVIGTAKM